MTSAFAMAWSVKPVRQGHGEANTIPGPGKPPQNFIGTDEQEPD